MCDGGTVSQGALLHTSDSLGKDEGCTVDDSGLVTTNARLVQTFLPPLPPMQSRVESQQQTSLLLRPYSVHAARNVPHMCTS